ncbi:MAG: siderophore-interacting protein [Cyclobacteriaceae bacterium]|nr:siderophore-interacting protein [Cyclobacteriaceae bacterium]
MQLFLLSVKSYHDVTPHMRRIRFVSDALIGKPEMFTPGIHVKILLPREGQARPVLPTIENGRPTYKPTDIHPVVRTYTVRACNSQTGELDIDFVLHGDEGPASAWAERVQAGDVIGIAVRPVKPLPQADWYLFAGDHTALPAISSFLEQLHGTAKGYAFIEVPDATEQQAFTHPENITVTWLHRNNHKAGTANLLHKAIQQIEIPSTGTRYVWLAAESTETKAMRTFIVENTTVQPAELHAVGYWRLGVDEDVYHDMRHRGE